VFTVENNIRVEIWEPKWNKEACDGDEKNPIQIKPGRGESKE
jgi:hypothetical protein